jgi:C1A family cysteine protease
MTQRNYGWRPDVPDARDYPYAAIRAAPARLPPSVDLRALCSPIDDQGQLGSCTANALTSACEFLEIKSKKAATELSRLFVYYNERVLERTVNSDSGAHLRDGIKTLAKQGACAEKLWPYNVASYTQMPPQGCYQDGSSRRITGYFRITTLADMKACLAEGYPFVFGFTAYASLESPQVAKTGVLALPAPGEQAIGGHAVVAVGYDDATQRFLVRNSWGPQWGQAGYFTMPYAYLDNPNLSDDMWTIRTEQIGAPMLQKAQALAAKQVAVTGRA